MRGLANWLGALALSALLNLAAGVGLLRALQPLPPPEQAQPESRLTVTAQEVPRSRAEGRPPESEAAAEGEARGADIGAGAVPLSRAEAAALPRQSAAVKTPEANALTPASETARPLAAAPLPAQSAQAVVAPPTALATSNPNSQSIGAARPAAQSARAQPLLSTQTEARRARASGITAPRPIQAAALQSSAAPAQLLTASLPAAATLPDRRPASAALPPQQPSATPRPTAAPPSQDLAAAPPPSQPAPPARPEVTRSRAQLAFPAGDGGPVDPLSLAAFASFTQPASLQSQDLRDGLAAALDLPCARLQVIFDPESARLTLAGHLPDSAQAAPLLADLRARMGSDIAVTSDLLTLPAPQCGALSGIARIGLPQSTDQITNPLILGQGTHARVFPFLQDDPLVLHLTAPDYPAYLYVDYFDAAGQVIHLSPNAESPLRRAAPEARVQIGAEVPGGAGLHVRIGPPYGQEIAAAFASSVPLYEGLRPLVEPAGPYLDWLRERVAEARAAEPDFKGEWVYFFVTTAPR